MCQKQLSKININYKGETISNQGLTTQNQSPKESTDLKGKSTLTNSAVNILQPKKTL